MRTEFHRLAVSQLPGLGNLKPYPNPAPPPPTPRSPKTVLQHQLLTTHTLKPYTYASKNLINNPQRQPQTSVVSCEESLKPYSLTIAIVIIIITTVSFCQVVKSWYLEAAIAEYLLLEFQGWKTLHWSKVFWSRKD